MQQNLLKSLDIFEMLSVTQKKIRQSEGQNTRETWLRMYDSESLTSEASQEIEQRSLFLYTNTTFELFQNVWY